MAASSSTELYSYAQSHIHTMHDDGAPSSEDGSGLHSPVFGAFPHAEPSIRYQQLDNPVLPYYSSLNVQQPPLNDSTLEHTRTGAQPVSFPFPVPRNQISVPFSVPPSANSRLSPPGHVGRPNDYRISSTERRLPGGLSHDLYTRPNGQQQQPTEIKPLDQKPFPVSAITTDHSEASKRDPATCSRERKPTSSMVIACRQCRARKIKCDSTRPMCNNCHRRSNPCEYDTVPKRRGPDKLPGTRKRTCKKRVVDGSAPPPPPPSLKRKRLVDHSPELQDIIPPRARPRISNGERNSSSPLTGSYDTLSPHERSDTQHYPSGLHSQILAHDIQLAATQAQSARFPTHNFVGNSPHQRTHHEILPNRPTMAYPNYASYPNSPNSDQGARDAWEQISGSYRIEDIIHTFRSLTIDGKLGHWLSFLNIDDLHRKLWSSVERTSVHPSFIYAGLAFSMLLQSSNRDLGEPARTNALHLRNEALRCLELAHNSNEQLDVTVAEAALIMVLFEQSPHPEHSPERVMAAIVMLDNIIRDMNLTQVDIADSDACIFRQHVVPTVEEGAFHEQTRCACVHPRAAQNPADYSFWRNPLPWDRAWDPSEIRKEEIRRVCWNAVSIVARYTTQCAALGTTPTGQFWLMDPSNFRLLFPGEAIDRRTPTYRASNSISTKEAIWALYCRSMLLWNYSYGLALQLQSYDSGTKQDNSAAIQDEARLIEMSLEQHGCNIDTEIIHQTREHIHNCRLLASELIRRSVSPPDIILGAPGPLINPKHMDNWVASEQKVVRVLLEEVHEARRHYDPTAHHVLIRQPYIAPWVAYQLTVAVRLGTLRPSSKLVELIDHLLIICGEINMQWPCDYFQASFETLRSQAVQIFAQVNSVNQSNRYNGYPA